MRRLEATSMPHRRSAGFAKRGSQKSIDMAVFGCMHGHSEGTFGKYRSSPDVEF
jgi:hypothetical protein